MHIQELLIGDVLVRALVSCHSSIDDRNEKKKNWGNLKGSGSGTLLRT